MQLIIFKIFNFRYVTNGTLCYISHISNTEYFKKYY